MIRRATHRDRNLLVVIERLGLITSPNRAHFANHNDFLPRFKRLANGLAVHDDGPRRAVPQRIKGNHRHLGLSA